MSKWLLKTLTLRSSGEVFGYRRAPLDGIPNKLTLGLQVSSPDRFAPQGLRKHRAAPANPHLRVISAQNSSIKAIRPPKSLTLGTRFLLRCLTEDLQCPQSAPKREDKIPPESAHRTEAGVGEVIFKPSGLARPAGSRKTSPVVRCGFVSVS